MINELNELDVKIIQSLNLELGLYFVKTYVNLKEVKDEISAADQRYMDFNPVTTDTFQGCKDRSALNKDNIFRSCYVDEDNPWIEWHKDAKEIIHMSEIVAVRFKSGSIKKGIADEFNWEMDGSKHSVVGFKLIKKDDLK